MQADIPPDPPSSASEIAISRRDTTEIVTSRDLPLILTKAGRREDALVRQALFITARLVVVRPAEAQDAAADRQRWTYRAFLQRQVCFTSITGLFACAASEVEALPETEEGEAPAESAAALAEAARTRLTASLKARATMLFEADRRSQTDPMLRAAGVARAVPPR